MKNITYLDKIIHEINNPMSSILLLSEIMLDETYAGQLPEILENIKQISASAKKIVNILEVLNSTSLSHDNTITFDRVETDIIAIMTKEVNYFNKTLIGTKNLKLVLATDLKEFFYKIDLFWFKQIINNLIINSIKYTDQGKIIISISEKYLHNNKYLSIAIIDDGVGIPEKELESIFEPLVRGSNNKNKQGNIPGSGIGLSVVKEVIQGHGGSITARNKDDKSGAIFEIILPIK